MCGIAGFVNLDGAPADADLLDAMTDRLRHRGPDDRGVISTPVTFAPTFEIAVEDAEVLRLHPGRAETHGPRDAPHVPPSEVARETGLAFARGSGQRRPTVHRHDGGRGHRHDGPVSGPTLAPSHRRTSSVAFQRPSYPCTFGPRTLAPSHPRTCEARSVIAFEDTPGVPDAPREAASDRSSRRP